MILYFILFFITSLTAQEEVPDTTYMQLEEVVVGATNAVPSSITSNAITFNKETLRAVPRSFGEADMLRLVTLLPGVSTVSDYSSGVSVYGSDYSQNMYLINGFPVLFPYHFGGLYSSFSTFLYPKGRVLRSATETTAPNVGGAIMELSSPSAQFDHISAETNIGMTASSVSVLLPINQKLFLGMSSRVSYISALYGNLIGSSDTRIKYDFTDFDLVPRFKINEKSSLYGTFHFNADDLLYTDANYSMSNKLRWKVLTSGIGYNFRDPDSGVEMETRLWWAFMRNSLRTSISNVNLSIFNEASHAGAEGHLSIPVHRNLFLLTGVMMEHYGDLPQWAHLEGYINLESQKPAYQNAFSTRIYTGIRWNYNDLTGIEVSCSANAYLTGKNENRYHNVAPIARLSSWVNLSNYVKLSLALHSNLQYNHYTGLVDIGMASNFRICANSALPPERSNHASLGIDWKLPELALEFSASGWITDIKNVSEYDGTVIDMLEPNFTSLDFIRMTKGYNTGFSIAATKNAGPVTGWISYTFSIGKRRLMNDRHNDWFTASSEIRNSLKTVITWKINNHWELGATYTYTSGRPCTPIKVFYFIGNRYTIEYGKRNSSHLPSYNRLDLSCSYRFITREPRKLEHCVNFSIMNATGYENAESQTYLIDFKNGTWKLRTYGSLFRFLPSLSYTLSL